MSGNEACQSPPEQTNPGSLDKLISGAEREGLRLQLNPWTDGPHLLQQTEKGEEGKEGGMGRERVHEN